MHTRTLSELMSGRCSVCSIDADDLEETRERLKELTKEKENLCSSSFESFVLIKKLESHVKSLSKSHDENQKRIADLENFLQDQLSKKNSDLNHLAESLCNLQLKVENIKYLSSDLETLIEKVTAFESEKYLLIQELEYKEDLINDLKSRPENLEESSSFMALKYECEMESNKMESFALNQNLCETKQRLEETSVENLSLRKLIKKLELQISVRDKFIENLNKGSEDLKERLQKSDLNSVAFSIKVEEQFRESLTRNEKSAAFSKLETDIRTYGNELGPLFSKLFVITKPPVANTQKTLHDNELLVGQLKEEMKLERLKAKEEAEELAQEMTELRYRMTSMLDDECKRRASIEKVSLQRIAELETKIVEERQKWMDLLEEHDSIFKNL